MKIPVAEAESGSFGGGDGTPSNPYQIEDVDDLLAMKNNLSANYILVNDINTSMYNWGGAQQIGISSDPFNGYLDGNHKNITGLNLYRIDDQYCGLLGVLGEDGVVENLNLAEVDVEGYAYIGSIAGESWGKISNCSASGNVTATLQQSGGLVGFNIGSIMNSTFNGNVTGPRIAGGLVGRNGYNSSSGSTILNCTSNVYVEGTYYDIGGIAGLNRALISNCTSAGFINNTGTQTGGLVGRNLQGIVRNSASAGDVKGDTFTGGLIGENEEGMVISCYSTSNVTGGENRIGGLIGSNYKGSILNSHYNIDKVRINGSNHLTPGGIYNDQYLDWIGNGLSLNISNYDSTINSSGGYYEIASVKGLEDMLGFADREGFRYRITSDIDLADSPGFFIPYFNGDEIDGRNHTITNLTINISSDCTGFIGMNRGGSIRNLRLSNANIKGMSYASPFVGYNSGNLTKCFVKVNIEGKSDIGVLCGYNSGNIFDCHARGFSNATDSETGGLLGYNEGTVINSSFKGSVRSTNSNVGGLIGYNAGGNISGCQSWGDVEGEQHNVGSFIGWNEIGKINNCSSKGNTSATLDRVGGFIGYNQDEIMNCSANGTVVGSGYHTGGLVGHNVDSNISESRFAGVVVARKRYAGGLIGRNENGIVRNCSADSTIKGENYFGGLLGYNHYGNIYNCSGKGEVLEQNPDSNSNYVGGLVGRNDHSKLEGNYFSGNVSGDNYAGGLFGYNDYCSMVENSATIRLIGRQYTGGLLGYNNYGSILNCSAVVDIDGWANVGGLVGLNNRGTIEDSHTSGYIESDTSAGGLVGGEDGTVNNCYSSCDMGGDGENQGGLIGWNSGVVTNCYATGKIEGDSYLGGLAGKNYDTLKNCFATGQVDGDDWNYGGLVGLNDESASIEKCLSVGDVEGWRYIGGFVGRNEGSISNCFSVGKTKGFKEIGGLVGINGGTVSKSYSRGRVRGSYTSDVGGLIGGLKYGGKTTYSFWDKNTSYQSSSNGGTGRTTSQMKLKSTFTNSNWDFDKTWIIAENITYPILQWQEKIIQRADAGQNLTFEAGNSLFLSGNGFWKDVGIVNWTWSLKDGENISLYGRNPSYKFNNKGSFLITLSIIDIWNKTSKDVVNITIVDYSPPFSNAGPDLTVHSGDLVILNGSGSFDNVRIANWTWTFTDIVPVTLYGEFSSYYFNNTGIFTITLNVTDTTGYSNNDTMNITVLESTPPFADAGQDLIVNEDDLITFNGSGSYDNVEIVNWTWTFSDGGPVSLYGEKTVYVFNEPGFYNVTLNVSDAAENWDNDTLNVTVVDVTSPITDAGQDQIVNEGTIVYFNGSSSFDNVGIMNWTWTLTDIVPVVLYGSTPFYLFKNPGVFSVILNVTDSSGNWNTDTVEITVLDITDPIAVAGRDQVVKEDISVQFDGSGSSDNVAVFNWTWTFSDRGPVSLYGENPRYVFKEPGIYNVTLNVTDNAGNWHEDFVTITVLDITDPVADAGPDQIVNEDVPVQFVGGGSSDNVDVVNWTWTFSDGGPVSLYGENPRYVFKEPGIYNVTLNVTDNAGNWHEDFVTITVLDITDPVADAGPDQIVNEDTILYFNGNGSFDNVDVVNWTWTFYDAEPVSLYGEKPLYVFSEPGTYIITLGIRDAAGNTDEDSIIITVLDVTDPFADAGSNQTIAEDMTIRFDGTGSFDNVGVVNWTWTFFDAEPVSLYGERPTYVFSEPGIYNITLNVTDSAGNWHENTVIITVVDVTDPVSDSGPDQIVNEDTIVHLNGSASLDNVGIVNWTWDFTDGKHVLLYGEYPTYVFREPGYYIITLNVTDETGNWNTDSMNVTVLDVTSPVADAGPDHVVEEDTVVIFDGNNSMDNVGIINWTWTMYGEEILYGSNPTFIFTEPGTYTFILNTSDSAGNWAIDMVNISVVDTTPPVAEAGNDLVVNEDSVFDLNGTKSFDNVAVVNWTWSLNDEVILYGGDPSFIIQQPGNYTIVLTVVDASGNFHTDSINVTVIDITPPVADAGSDQNIDEGTLLSFDGSVSFDNVGIVNWTWTIYGDEEINLYGIDPDYLFAELGTFMVELKVTDSAGNGHTDKMNITVVDITSPEAVPGEDQVVPIGTRVILNGSGSSDNGIISIYTWAFTYSGEDVILEGEEVRFQFHEAGTYEVTLTVTDGNGNEDRDNLSVTVVETGIVRGTVLDKDGNIVEGAIVDIVGSNGEKKTTTTGSDGSFSLEIVNGDFVYNISKDGYKTLSGTSSVEAMGESDIDLEGRPLVEKPEEEAGPHLWILLIIIVVLVLIAVVLFFLFRKKKEPEEESGRDENEPGQIPDQVDQQTESDSLETSRIDSPDQVLSQPDNPLQETPSEIDDPSEYPVRENPSDDLVNIDVNIDRQTILPEQRSGQDQNTSYMNNLEKQNDQMNYS